MDIVFFTKVAVKTASSSLALIAQPPHQCFQSKCLRSLLYEASGRLVNSTYGAFGLFWTGEWSRCEAVLIGSDINGAIVVDGKIPSTTLMAKTMLFQFQQPMIYTTWQKAPTWTSKRKFNLRRSDKFSNLIYKLILSTQKHF
ncbi:hypothetical protein KIW84_040974 [Lathyrus oleraceus]|uniref:Uncharacterized protein n=1 Tax=Pisum sativum TaxID=3888 RepID=A0A9D4X8K3_PEA|nr:hypothetical protein KIW84_040974 [Pisum sativum]